MLRHRRPPIQTKIMCGSTVSVAAGDRCTTVVSSATHQDINNRLQCKWYFESGYLRPRVHVHGVGHMCPTPQPAGSRLQRLAAHPAQTASSGPRSPTLGPPAQRGAHAPAWDPRSGHVHQPCFAPHALQMGRRSNTPQLRRLSPLAPPGRPTAALDPSGGTAPGIWQPRHCSGRSTAAAGGHHSPASSEGPDQATADCWPSSSGDGCHGTASHAAMADAGPARPVPCTALPASTLHSMATGHALSW
jgi:hypothetical protein